MTAATDENPIDLMENIPIEADEIGAYELSY